MSLPQLQATPVSRSQKAAMVVQLILREGSDLPLNELPENAQARLARELGALSIIDKDTLHNVAEEFADALDNVGLTAPGSVEAALRSLDGHISPATAARLREEAGANGNVDHWAQVAALEAEDMIPITEAESPEICAVMLSKIPTDKAAALLNLMPGASARRIAYAMSKTASILPPAIARIGEGLAQNYCGGSISSFTESAENRIGAILNSSAPTTRATVLEGLLEQDPDFGKSVRKAIFTFEDIPSRLEITDVPKILRDVDNGDLVRALASAKATGANFAVVSEYLLENMSKRMAENLRDEMSEAGSIKAADGEAAQSAVVAAIRSAAEAGTIALVTPEVED